MSFFPTPKKSIFLEQTPSCWNQIFIQSTDIQKVNCCSKLTSVGQLFSPYSPKTVAGAVMLKTLKEREVQSKAYHVPKFGKGSFSETGGRQETGEAKKWQRPFHRSKDGSQHQNIPGPKTGRSKQDHGNNLRWWCLALGSHPWHSYPVW